MLTPDNLAQLSKGAQQHKYDHGHALVLAGGVGRGGAGRLAARGALRIGAGLVTLGCPPAALIENAAQLTAIMLARVDGPEALAAILEDTRINALCVGPGLGLDDRARELVEVALRSGRAVTLDADALTLLAGDPGLGARLHRAVVLTPHEGEFARLVPELGQRVLGVDKPEAARQAAQRFGCTVLLKGAETVVAGPDGAHWRQNRPAPWLATAGAGDVLAGFLTGLMARGFAPFEAACTAAALHVDCAQQVGPGLIAEDLPEALPAIFKRLGL